jgi:hypothetical protein
MYVGSKIFENEMMIVLIPDLLTGKRSTIVDALMFLM